MPSLLSVDGSLVGKPKNWSQWSYLVQKTIERYSGQNTVLPCGVNYPYWRTDIYYEVWNEPDLFGRFKLSGSKSYLDLYYHTHNGALKAKNVLPFRIGGPGTTGHYKNWLSGILDFVRRNSLRFDFYSYYTYSLDISQFENDYLDAKKILSASTPYQNVEILITEFGLTGENDKRYDNLFGAIHNLAVSASLEGKVDRFFTFEIKDGVGPEKYWGRWGILTNEKWGTPEEKPRFKSLEFLNKMVGNRVNIAGTGSWVKGFASENGGVIRLLLVNYDPSGKHYEAVPINFVNLPFRNFKYSREDFLGSRTQRNVQVDSNSWQTVEGLKSNSAVILELSPL
jgi:hypothetical protein